MSIFNTIVVAVEGERSSSTQDLGVHAASCACAALQHECDVTYVCINWT